MPTFSSLMMKYLIFVFKYFIILNKTLTLLISQNASSRFLEYISLPYENSGKGFIEGKVNTNNYDYKNSSFNSGKGKYDKFYHPDITKVLSANASHKPVIIYFSELRDFSHNYRNSNNFYNLFVNRRKTQTMKIFKQLTFTCTLSNVAEGLNNSALDNNMSKLNPYFVTGYCDAEGSFYIGITKESQYRTGYRVRTVFSISIHPRDKALLEKIHKYFRVGRVIVRSDGYIQFRVDAIKDLLQILAHFDKYPLLTKKRFDYDYFKQVIVLILRKKHLTTEGQIRLSLNSSMCWNNYNRCQISRIWYWMYQTEANGNSEKELYLNQQERLNKLVHNENYRYWLGGSIRWRVFGCIHFCSGLRAPGSLSGSYRGSYRALIGARGSGLFSGLGVGARACKKKIVKLNMV